MANDFEATFNKYDLVMMNNMLCAYCRAGEMESVMQTLKKMDGLAISPDYNTFHILIRYFSKEKMYLLAYRTIKDMHSKGYQPSEVLPMVTIERPILELNYGPKYRIFYHFIYYFYIFLQNYFSYELLPPSHIIRWIFLLILFQNVR